MNITQRYLIILNPVAGKGKAAGKRHLIEKALNESGAEYEITVTQGIEHAMHLAEDAGENGFTVAVAAGGDGTVNEVINGLMQAKQKGKKVCILGVLAIGRGNDFACGARIPSDLDKALQVLVAGHQQGMDVGRVSGGYYPHGKYFGNGMGIGFDTLVGLEAAKMRHVHGGTAYMLGAIKMMIIYPEPPEITIRWGDKEYCQKSHQISIMNGIRMGGSFYMAPNAKNNDGFLDICMSKEIPRSKMPGLTVHYTKGTQHTSPLIVTDRARSIVVTAPKGGLAVHADGETICKDGHELLIECLERELTIICPSDGHE